MYYSPYRFDLDAEIPKGHPKLPSEKRRVAFAALAASEVRILKNGIGGEQPEERFDAFAYSGRIYVRQSSTCRFMFECSIEGDRLVDVYYFEDFGERPYNREPEQLFNEIVRIMIGESQACTTPERIA